MPGQRRVDEGVVAIEQFQNRTVIGDDIGNETHRLLEQGRL